MEKQKTTSNMNEITLSTDELETIKEVLTRHYTEDQPKVELIIRKIDILLKEPEDEGGYTGVVL